MSRKLILILPLIIFMSSFVYADLTTNNVLYWSFDDADLTGGLADDMSGNNNDMDTNTGGSGISGILGESFEYDGTEYATVDMSTWLNTFDTVDKAICIWFNVDSFGASANSLIAMEDADNNPRFFVDFVSSGNNLRFQINNDAGALYGGSYVHGLSTGTWNQYCNSWDFSTGTSKVYVNGVYKHTQTSAPGTISQWSSAEPLTIGARNTAGSISQYLDTDLDELSLWDRELTDDSCLLGNTCGGEIAELWNSGAGYNPYNITPPASDPYHQVKITNKYTGSNIVGVNITLNNSVSNLTQADGIAYFSNYTGNLTFNGSLVNYFNITGIAVENQTVNYEMYQSEINFNCYEKITNNTLNCANSTIYPNANTYNFTVNVNNYYPVTQEETITALDNKTINFTGFANSYLNTSAINIRTNATINNYTLIYTDINNGWSETLTANGLYLNNTLIEGKNYSIEIHAVGFEYKTVNLTNFTSQSYRFDLYTANSILINIFQESDGSRIYENVTARFTDDLSNINEYVTNTSILYVDNLTISNYTIEFISVNYSTRSYTITVGNNTFQSLDAYLVDDGASSTVFEFQNKNTGATLEGVTLTIQKLINTTWTVVEVLSSDVTGRTSFDYIDDETYKFIASLSGYTTKIWTLSPILFSSYTIKMDQTISEADSSDYSGINIYFTPNIYYNNQNNSISFTFVSPDGEFTAYGFNATYNGTYITGSGVNAYGGIITNNLEIINASITDLVILNYYYILSDGDTKTYTKTYTIDGASSTTGTIVKGLSGTYGLGIFERVLIVVGLVLLVMGAGAYYGGAIAGGVLGAFLFGLFAYTGFIPLWSVIVSIITLFIVTTWRSSL